MDSSEWPRTVLTLALVSLFLFSIGTPARIVSARSAAALEGVPAFGHVFIIIGENTELSQLTIANAPYLLGTLRPTAAWLTEYFAITHHSAANYVAMTSGQYKHCEREDGTPAQCHQKVDNLFHQLDVARISWLSWMESMPKACGLSSSGSDASLNPYTTSHNPAIFYDDIEGAGGVWSATSPSAECLSSDIPAGTTGPDNVTELNAALASGNVGRFNLIVPNKCEDGHDACAPVSNRILQFDDFLSREVPLILSSPAFGADGILVVTFDEGTTGGHNPLDQFGRGGHVAFAVVSPLAKSGVYGGAFDHYGFLRTLEDGFVLSEYLGDAARVAPINTIWGP